MTKIQAIKASLEHHKENLRLLETVEGKFVNDDERYFIIGETQIFYNSEQCALCEYDREADGEFYCENCPLYQHGYICNKWGSPWKKIWHSKTKSKAILAEKGMVKVLEKVLRKEEAL